MFLRGSRDYVQGTQIITSAAEYLSDDTLYLKAASLTNLTKNIVHFSREKRQNAIGKIEFKSASGKEICFVADSDLPAPRKSDSMGINVNRPNSDEGKTFYEFEGEGKFESILNIMVQAVKAEHSHLYKGAYDIWFTGLRGTDMKVADRYPTSGKVALSLERKLVSADTIQTIWRFEFIKSDAEICASGVTTFSFRQRSM